MVPCVVGRRRRLTSLVCRSCVVVRRWSFALGRSRGRVGRLGHEQLTLWRSRGRAGGWDTSIAQRTLDNPTQNNHVADGNGNDTGSGGSMRRWRMTSPIETALDDDEHHRPRRREHPSSEPEGGCSREKTNGNAFFPIAVTKVLCGFHSAWPTTGGVGGVGGVKITPRGHASRPIFYTGLGGVISDPVLR